MGAPTGAAARVDDMWSPSATPDDSDDSLGGACAFQPAKEAKPISNAQVHCAAALPVAQMRPASSTPVATEEASPTHATKVLKRESMPPDPNAVRLACSNHSSLK